MKTEIEDRYIQAVQKAGASIVNVQTEISANGHCCMPFQKSCSGVVLDKDGHILVARDALCQAEHVTVIMNNGHLFTGVFVGDDQLTNTAVIKIESDELVPAELGDSDILRVGQPIFAIGNSLGMPGGLTATSGVISALPRLPIMGQSGVAVLVHDALVNPTNSVGPLVSLDGNVVGINAARTPYSGGMSIAIPINRAKSIAEEIIRHGKVQRSWLGVTANDITPRLVYQFQLPDMDGVFVAEVVPGGPAEGAGVRIGDVLLSLDEKKVNNVVDLLTALHGMRSEQAIEMKVRRNERMEVIHVTLGTRPY